MGRGIRNSFERISATLEKEAAEQEVDAAEETQPSDLVDDVARLQRGEILDDCNSSDSTEE